MRKIGFISNLRKTKTKEKESDLILDVSFEQTEAKRLYLKKMSIDSVLNFVGRIMSTAKFKVIDTDGKKHKEWEYTLNVRPNLDMSATLFWQRLFYKLLFDNEVLVIFTEDDQLLIADGFMRNKYAVFEDTFESVSVKDYVFKKKFNMSDVIYLEYSNNELQNITKELFNDYNELFGRMLEISMRNNQIRATVSLEGTGTASEETGADGKTRLERVNGLVNRAFDSFRTSSVAIIPKLKGFEYEEHTNKTNNSNQSIEELTKLKKSLIDDVARLIGVPVALIHGEMADLGFNVESCKKFCINPLIKKLEDELNAKIFTKLEFISGARVKVQGVLPRDPVELATQIDKLVSSSTFFIDEVREEFEYEELPEGQGKNLVRTKNYEEVKGGEKGNE